jgi:hypothetical protein
MYENDQLSLRTGKLDKSRDETVDVLEIVQRQ